MISSEKLAGNTFSIICEGSFMASELVERGKYWLTSSITDERFPMAQHVPMTRKIVLVKFEYDLTSDEVLAEFNRRSLERPTYEDAFYFGIQPYAEYKQTRHRIVFLHEPVQVPNGRCVVVLLGGGSWRHLTLYRFGNRWSRGYVFAAVRK